MIITISGDAGSGKSTVAKLIAKKLNYKHYSGGDMRGLLAEEKGMTIDELNKLGEKEQWTDNAVDERIALLGKEEDDFVIDSRLAFHFIPKSIKIFLTCNLDESARRIFTSRHTEKGREDEKMYATIKEAKENIIKRTESDIKRYKKYYGIDHTQKSNYDLVIDTTKTMPDEVVDKILKFVKKIKM